MAGRCSCRRCCRWREASPSLATKRGQDAKGANKFIRSSQATRGGPPRAMPILLAAPAGGSMSFRREMDPTWLPLKPRSPILSLSLPARALTARELSFVLLETRSGFPKPKTEIQSLGEDRRGRQEVGEAQALVVVLVGHEDVTHPFKHHPIIIIIMANHWTQLSSDRSARDPRQQRSGPGTYFVPSEAEEVQTQNAKLSDLGSPSVHTPLQNQF